ncbi:16S rRNA (cytidine(1402)-2'-O)-methyltransferase [Candidatus Collierbacteria bacterium RIFCSPLOWO2_01_FULL_50_23]|nr:MAG: 16S rRNA (cytidine(1402)-2'-O)-methyltransferase [Candidatus Collierbacteria bacterium RIFCSPHIGHO2_01_FULL_50_25]OGD75159.1 MAG: 16S rRNA (cytidine(1402)-2'-O)-methyltransferase [Candidatus Collierbacteria bacterium RIFCSPLOWO2_01_FULL_50_23]
MKLTLVGLPLGNIEDISLRAIRTLREAKTVICEDTRMFYKLWQKLVNDGHLQTSFSGRLMVVNDFNEAEKVAWLIDQITLAGEAILVSDAGMPLISDPGYRIVKEILAREGTVEVIPGPTAAMTALSVSGLSADKVLFLGFLSKKTGKRNENWKLVKEADGITVILYEAPVRVQKTLEEIQAGFGPETPVVIARELTKEYEQIIRGKISDVLANLKPIKGEVVILFRR